MSRLHPPQTTNRSRQKSACDRKSRGLLSWSVPSEGSLGGASADNEVVEEEEAEEEELELPAEGISAEEARLTAEYLASLDSQWSEDPPNHRSGQCSACNSQEGL